MTHRKKLIEVALPLEAINIASAREKSIRHGHPSTLHLWWARRPLAAARAVIFTSLVDDPDDPNALPAFVEACRKLPKGKNVDANGDTPRMRLFDFIERLVTWEATTDEAILNTARELIQIATEGNPPPLLDPFAGGGSIPLEAQRLGLEAHASDLNPVAVMINKAQIEIPPRFANMPPVNPRDRAGMFAPTPNPSPIKREGNQSVDKWEISPELERRMQAVARELRKSQTPAEDTLWQAIRKNQVDGRKFRRQMAIGAFVVDFYCSSERLAVEVDGPIHDTQREADQMRQELIESLGIRFVRLTNDEVERDVQAAVAKIRGAFHPHPKSLPQNEGGTLKQNAAGTLKQNAAGTLKQNAAGTFDSASLPVEELSTPLPSLWGKGLGDGGADSTWRGAAGLAADVRYYGEWMREKAWERIGHLYPTHNGETVIAWIWARTVKSPNPAVNAHVPLVRSFILSKKKGRECWARPIVTPTPGPSPKMREGKVTRPDSLPQNNAETLPPSLPVGEGAGGWGGQTHTIRFEVTPGAPPKGQDGTMLTRKGAICLVSGEPIPKDWIKAEGVAGHMGAMLMAIVTEGQSGRSYYSPDEWHAKIAQSAEPEWEPIGQIPDDKRSMFTPLYGLTEFRHLFTPRQLVALTTFSDLVHEARQQAHADALAAGLPDDGVPLREGGRGALAYAEAVSVYLAFAVDRTTNYSNTFTIWSSSRDQIVHGFGRQAIPMTWDHPEVNIFAGNAGDFYEACNSISKVIPNAGFRGFAVQQDAVHLKRSTTIIATDPPYYDLVGYADLSDFFYVWLRKTLRDVYPDIFGTMLVPKAPELIASPYRHGGKEAANQHFESGMFATFSNIRRFITPDYPLTVYYAFKQQDAETGEDDEDPSPPDPLSHNKLGRGGDSSPSPREERAVGEGFRVRGTVASTGWETMLASLIHAGFSIDGTWPMRTERATGLKASVNALASSIVLVCRPRPDDAPTTSRRAFMDDLRRELPAALREMQSGNIAPVDLAQASIGPGMAIYSRYSKVLEADGSPMSVRAALGLINAALDEYLAEQDGDIDADTRFAVAWFEQFGFSEGDFGQADVLARAKNTSVAGVESAGLVASGRGKVRLVHWTEYDPANSPRPKSLPQNEGGTLPPSLAAGGRAGDGGWDPQQDKRPTVWEAAHHLIERLNSHGETGSAMLMTRMPHDMAAEARNLAYRLYSICERKGWADHARDYNALVMSWAGIGEETARLREAAESGQATRQMTMFGEE